MYPQREFWIKLDQVPIYFLLGGELQYNDDK